MTPWSHNGAAPESAGAPDDGDGAAVSATAASGAGPCGPTAADPVPLDQATDEELLARVRDRDRAAFRAVFDRYASRIKAFMMRDGAAPDVAEEAAQEALLAVWRRAETFDPSRASAAAWVFAIARNKRVDLFRRGARPAPDPEDPSFQPDPEPTPEQAFGDEARDRRVRAALADLTSEQRAVVLMSFYEGRPHSEIADMLDIPLGTVKSRLRLAFGRLRKALGDAFADELSGA
ncbi:MAG: sigma-70 family RNA polymerase sigma factor [Pseudomonadota bacterium]